MTAQFYDAAADPRLWPAALNALAQAFDANFAAFGWENTNIMTVGGGFGSRALSKEETKHYSETYKRTVVYSNPMPCRCF